MPTLSKNNAQLYLTIAFLIFIFVVAYFAIIKIGEGRKGENNTNFSRGLMVMNTNKSSYLLNEKVTVYLLSLDQEGKNLCHSNLELIIKSPSDKETHLSTENGQIFTSPTCSEDNYVENEYDYTAFFTTSEEGDYKITIKNLDLKNTIEDKIKVFKEEKFSIERKSPTLINPFITERYPMIIVINSKDNFKGQVIEQIPVSLNIVWQGPAKVETMDNLKAITWEVDLKAGESKEFIYEYQAPKESFKEYTLGYLKIMSDGIELFSEVKKWKVVSGK